MAPEWRVSVWDEMRIAYSLESFKLHYGDAAQHQWDSAHRVFDQDENMLQCYVCFEAPGGECDPWCTCLGNCCGAWCAVDALEESSFLKGLLEDFTPGESVVLKLGHLVPVHKDVGAQLLLYFRSESSWWTSEPTWGALSYANKLGLHLLVNTVAKNGDAGRFRSWLQQT